MSVPKTPPGHFVLLYFAAASSFTRKQYDHFPAPLDVTDIFDVLEKRYPGMKEKVLTSCAVTVNLEYVDLDEEAGKGDQSLIIQENDEIGIIPPVSSG